MWDVWLACSFGCFVLLDRWSALHLADGSLFDLGRWMAQVNMLHSHARLWPPSLLQVVDNPLTLPNRRSMCGICMMIA